MNPWQATFFGLKRIPRELTAFEIEAFFTFTTTERQVIEQRRRAALKGIGVADRLSADEWPSPRCRAHRARRLVAPSRRAIQRGGTGFGVAARHVRPRQYTL